MDSVVLFPEDTEGEMPPLYRWKEGFATIAANSIGRA